MAYDGPDTADADARARTQDLAMGSDDFWTAIHLLDGECTDESVDALQDRLSQQRVGRIVAFEAALTLALADLDTRAAFDWYGANDPDAADLGVSDDVFLYARCATVASGRAVWERAVAEKTLTATGDAESGERLLFVASDAAGGDTDSWHPDVIPLSYETGSNEAGWGSAN